MTAETLQEALGEVRDEWILDADAPVMKKKNRRIRWAAAAACLCLLATAAGILWANRSAALKVRPWTANMPAGDYFRDSGKGKRTEGAFRSASLVMMPYVVSVPLDDQREALEQEGLLPVMPDHPEQFFYAGFNGDGSLYQVSFTWIRRDGDDLTRNSALWFTAAPQPLHEISDCIVVRTDGNGNEIPPETTVTERDGVMIVAEGGEREQKTLTWQTEMGWYRIRGGVYDSYEDMAALLDWFWAHPLPLSRFEEMAQDVLVAVDRADRPEIFREQIPDFAALGYTAERERIHLWEDDGESKPVWFEGVYTRGETRLRWTLNTGADADDWHACVGSPEDTTEEAVKEAVDQQGFCNLYFGVPHCMATLTVEQGDASDAWEVVRSLRDNG